MFYEMKKIKLKKGKSMKKIIKLSLVTLMASATFVSADSSDVASLTNTLLNKLEMPEDSPDWLKRTSFKIQVEEDFKPTWELETVQPIKQFSKDDMMFWQFNAMTRDSKETYNLGLGYRNIINPELMLGINSFYDYQQDYKHKRWSIGVEAIGAKYEFRANRYMAISDKIEVETGVFEEALDGWDAQVGGKIFPTSDLRVYATYSVWNAKTVDDFKQTSFKAEYPINDSINFTLQHTKDSEKQKDMDDNRFMAQLEITLGKKSKSSQNLQKSENLHDKLLIPVERENEITVERTVGAKITIGRGT